MIQISIVFREKEKLIFFLHLTQILIPFSLFGLWEVMAGLKSR